MALVTGSCTLAINPTTAVVSATGSGLALRIGARLGQVMIGTPIAAAISAGGDAAAMAATVSAATLAQIEGMATAIALSVVEEIQANATAKIPSGLSLGYVPTPDTPGAAIDGPAVDIFVAIE